ncbi:transposase [Magnetospirillum sp. SS-4]|uniref:transposase n=1 Tax=Magnetospirillum sp. SS-4 TaxID=2681465 RepID=UPI0034CF6692
MVCDGSSDERPARRRHWPEAEKRRMVAEVEASGRSVAEIARRYRLASSVLGRWCARYGTKMPPATAPSFVPVTVAASAAEMKKPDAPGVERHGSRSCSPMVGGWLRMRALRPRVCAC